MLLEKPSNKVNSEKNIYRPTWKAQTEKSSDKSRSMGVMRKRRVDVEKKGD